MEHLDNSSCCSSNETNSLAVHAGDRALTDARRGEPARRGCCVSSFGRPCATEWGPPPTNG